LRVDDALQTKRRTHGMGSTGKKKTTMAKLARESRLRERRQEKEARKRARKDAAAYRAIHGDPWPDADGADDAAPGEEMSADIGDPTVVASHGEGSSADRST
jgi:hypothetical protein